MENKSGMRIQAKDVNFPSPLTFRHRYLLPYPSPRPQPVEGWNSRRLLMSLKSLPSGFSCSPSLREFRISCARELRMPKPLTSLSWPLMAATSRPHPSPISKAHPLWGGGGCFLVSGRAGRAGWVGWVGGWLLESVWFHVGVNISRIFCLPVDI